MMEEGLHDAGRDNRADNSLIGAAGVHYAAYKLTRKGLLALPTVRNTPGTDLIVTSLDGTRHANIQVKTSQRRVRFWPICSAKRFRRLPFGKNDYYLLLRPREMGDNSGDEFEGFLLTAAEAKVELEAPLKYWGDRGREPKFSLCIYADKGRREKQKPWPPDLKERWRKRWQEFKI